MVYKVIHTHCWTEPQTTSVRWTVPIWQMRKQTLMGKGHKITRYRISIIISLFTVRLREVKYWPEIMQT